MEVIKIDNVTKKFRIYQEKNTTLKERLIYAGRSKFKEFLAIDNINLMISKGQTVGLIGKNGSGKSTLLKLMTRIIYPTKGTIEISGRVSSLLELGAGFHPDFTGRENIYMNASVMGLTKKEIDKRLDDIIRFSELEEFIDNPVRSYSSGMYMRLAFSVAINVEPDILLVDEVLAVGDASFQRKCINRIKEMKRRGKTIVFVSHDQGVMEKLCDTIFWLNEGKIKDFGDPKRVIDAYLSYMDQKDEIRHFKEITPKDEKKTLSRKEKEENNRWGNRDIEITAVELRDHLNRERYVYQTEEFFEIQVQYSIQKKPKSIVFGIGFETLDDIKCFGTNTFIEKVSFQDVPINGKVTFRVNELPLLSGTYKINVAIHSDEGIPYDFWRGCKTFEVRSNLQDVGISRIKHSWEICNE